MSFSLHRRGFPFLASTVRTKRIGSTGRSDLRLPKEANRIQAPLTFAAQYHTAASSVAAWSSCQRPESRHETLHGHLRRAGSRRMLRNRRTAIRAVEKESLTADLASNNHDQNQNDAIKNSSSAVGDYNTEWIPPQHALGGDKGQSHLFSHVAPTVVNGDKDEQSDDNSSSSLSDQSARATTEKILPDATTATNFPAQPVDWLVTRRARLDPASAASSSLWKPHEARQKAEAHVDQDIPIIKHTLLARREIMGLLKSLGGTDIQVVLDTVGRMGGAPLVGIVIVTGSHYSHLQTLTDGVIRQLRRRNLQDVGVLGASMGADGNWKDPKERWFVVDCHNYVVHIFDERTRRAINLEGLWSGQDGLHMVDMDNDDAVEDYIAAHPVPEDYGSSSSMDDGGDWDYTLKQLEKNSWTAPRQRPLMAAAPKRRKKRSGRNT